MGAVGVIGGSGAGELETFRDWELARVETRFGVAEVRCGELYGRPVLFASRHGRDHGVPPHAVNYRAIVAALSHLGAERIIGTGAVGSLSPGLAPGTGAVLTDFIDFSQRGATTFFDGAEGAVHTDFSEPYCPEVSSALLAASGEAGLEVTTPCTYVCTSGPRFETPAEIAMFRSWGADVVGMTNAPEAILTRETGICYGAIALITNFAAGISLTLLSHAEVVAMMKSIEGKVTSVIVGAIKLIPAERGCACQAQRDPLRGPPR